MPASVIWIPSSVSVGTYGGRNGGKFENDKNKTLLYQNLFHIHFVPSALSCALPAFLLFFLPGN
ncbi:unnamed protein product [Staurois parvus]|uniref:Uncharacterized protein n=1 Tax=Staurois parvus TaxID=386267 RepID=A0ABN9DTA4_9NEOB|nr:unnamed protein product [Staurois parvus]